MTLFTGISRLHTFEGFLKKSGRHPKAEDVAFIDRAAMLVSKSGLVLWTGREVNWPTFAKSHSVAWRKKVLKVSLKNRQVLPSFTECHTHLIYAGSRSEEFEMRNRGDSYLSIAEKGGGIRSTITATSKASLSELELGVMERLQEFVRQGVTTVEIKTGYAGTISEEKRHLTLLCKIRASTARRKLPRVVITCLAAHSIPEGETEATWLDKVEALLPFVKKCDARLDIFIEQGAFSKLLAEKILRRARALEIPILIHADQLSRSGGTALGATLEALSVDHVIESGEKEIAQLANSPTVAVLLPAADLYTRLAYPKARAMLTAGVKVALATDHNPGTSPGLDIALVGVLARTQMQMTLPEVLCAYTVNAATALGGSDHVGALTVGRSADFLVLAKGKELADLFYEIGPRRSHACISEVWLGARQLV